MNIEFDPEANALYLKLRSGKVEKTKEVEPGVILDFDKTGNVLGVEVLYVHQRMGQPKVSPRQRPRAKRQVA
jgi:uncharacterized protein YuzE